MNVILQHYKVEATIALEPKDLAAAIESACKRLGRFRNDVEYVIQQPLPHVTVEVRKSTNKHEPKS